MQHIKKQYLNTSSNVQHQQNRKKWTTFTYVGKEVHHNTKLFNKQDLGGE